MHIKGISSTVYFQYRIALSCNCFVDLCKYPVIIGSSILTTRSFPLTWKYISTQILISKHWQLNGICVGSSLDLKNRKYGYSENMACTIKWLLLGNFVIKIFYCTKKSKNIFKELNCQNKVLCVGRNIKINVDW